MNTMLSLAVRVLQIVVPTIVLAVIARLSLRFLTLGRYPKRTRWLPGWDDIDVLEVIGATECLLVLSVAAWFASR
ncbi:hypothetical protein CIC12_23115 [Burkholderia sp. SG-MS1]|uniref:hypothetical protein n=1 Tax=Paraburkholderia sp. SG-MS1 TaxID=2023741 RepID=UPI001446F1B2|nr:hypothetical protein [Paraburkholderia sp. SG-MS1]NKJ49569.1 hypothetical protein [Paraburkholderia sp. SG-MS1]